jgi:hypothetical protein
MIHRHFQHFFKLLAGAPKLWLALMLALTFIDAPSGRAAEPSRGVMQAEVVNLALPIHQKPKLHPELSDPVLGDQVQIVEWAWSPQYAKRYNLPVQPNGLKDGGLWLIGVKVMRVQVGSYQAYECHIIGLIDNKLPMLTPPGDRFVRHPIDSAGLPKNISQTAPAPEGKRELLTQRDASQLEFVPAQAAWRKQPRNKAEVERPETGIGTPYVAFHRFSSDDLSYFELRGACGFFRDAETFRNEIRFPTRIDGKNDADKLLSAVYEPSAIKFDIPDGLMQKMYPYIREAEDWSSCLMRRTGLKGVVLTLRSIKSRRFGDICNPPGGTPSR